MYVTLLREIERYKNYPTDPKRSAVFNKTKPKCTTVECFKSQFYDQAAGSRSGRAAGRGSTRWAISYPAGCRRLHSAVRTHSGGSRRVVVLCMCLLLYSNKTLTEGKKNMIKQKPTASSVSRKDTGYFR